MHKNQLQELAQRSYFGRPAYSCVREGPDHAPRFKATVDFNGEIFESPSFCNTLRQAEHSAAEAAVNALSRRSPSLLLAAKIIDETGVCKNLLQETAQRAGVSLPVYTTVRSGPGHLPVFKCAVQVSGMTFVGESAKTKKQAEKNAATAAWSALKQLTSGAGSVLHSQLELDEHQEHDLGGLVVRGKDEQTAIVPKFRPLPCSEAVVRVTHPFSAGSRVRTINDIDSYGQSDGNPVGQFYTGSSSCVTGETRLEELKTQAYILGFNQRAIVASGRSSSPLKSSYVYRNSVPMREYSMCSRQARTVNRAASGPGRVDSIRSFPMAPCSQKNEPQLAVEEHAKDEDEVQRADNLRCSHQREVDGITEVDKSSYKSMGSSRTAASEWWGSQLPTASTSNHMDAFGLRPGTSLPPPVRVRQIAAVCSAPSPRRYNHPPVRVRQVATVCSAPPPKQLDRAAKAVDGDSSNGEAETRNIFKQLRL